MKTNNIINLLSYYLIFSSDNNLDSHISYFVEKYNCFFKEKPNEKVCKNILKDNKSLMGRTNFELNMRNFRFTDKDENYYIYFFTYYFIIKTRIKLRSLKSGYKNYVYDEDIQNKEYLLTKIFSVYKEFFNDFDNIKNNDLSYKIHGVLRNEIDNIINENNRLFKILKIKEKSNKSNFFNI